jgi:hypothetical protein
VEYYLVVYDRSVGEIMRHDRFHASDPALAARFDAEREFRNEPDIEVVVLGADSWDALKVTHSRYFKRAREMARAALERESHPS